MPPVKGIYAGNAEHTMKVERAHHEDPLRRCSTRMRIWLPDAPGVLGAVAAEIGAVEGNVIGLEVLEREAGVAIDEFVVELPDAARRGRRGVQGDPQHPRGRAWRRCANWPASSRTARTPSSTPRRPSCRRPRPTAAMNALSGQLISLFDLTWLAVADLGTGSFVEVHGEVPTIAWVAAFAEGSQSGSDPSNDTTSSGVFVEAIPDTELTVCGGRPAPIRRRERHAIAMLVVVTARFVDALGWREHAH